MSDQQPPERELKAGGPLDAEDHLYVARDADQEFLDLLKANEFVNVVTSRQMGKTSLVYHAMAELLPQGYHFAYFDLAKLRSETDRHTYFQTLVSELDRELNPGIDLDSFWAQRANLAASQGFVDFFRDTLAKLQGPIVVVLDEIDSTLELPFTDDLFTAIRSIYTGRPREPEFKRLMFCLVGVATPNELIKTRRTTPYNIGRTIWLTDFDAQCDDLHPLAHALSEDPLIADALLQRVFYWSGGQPYITAWMCEEVRRESAREPAMVDALVERTFTNLDQIRGASTFDPTHFDQTQRFMSDDTEHGAEVLALYERVLRGQIEKDQTANVAYTHLKLSGLVKRDANGILVPRNRIYERLFNLEWVQKSRPKRALRKARGIAYGAAALLLIGMVGGLFYYQTDVAPKQSQLQARETLEKLGVTLQKDYRGWTNVMLSGKDADKDPQSVLQRAAPELAILGKERDSAGLYLDLSSLAIKDLSPLAGITGLRRLDVSATKITDLTPLAKLTDLQELDLSGTPVADLAPLANLVGLRQLSVARTSIKDLAALRGLVGLQQLDISATHITDLSPLMQLNALQQLDVSDTAVDDVNPLAHLTPLQELNLSKTKVKTLAPLNGLQNLRTLILDGLDVGKFDVNWHLPHLKILRGETPNAHLGALKPGDTFRDCAQCPDMVVVPAGRFTIGSSPDEASRFENEGPTQTVTLARPFAVGKFEVRFDEWTACVQDQACRAPQDEGYGRGARPVINVSWDDANRYVAWLTKKSGKPYRLLTEAEWEYAARAGSKGAHFWDAPSASACTFANVSNPSINKKYNQTWTVFDCEDGYVATAPSGSFKPNAFGLYDMLGNAWEWVEDCYHDSYKDAPTDGSAWTTGECASRVIRGGGWIDVPRNVRAAYRYGDSPGDRVGSLGFRVARTLSP